MSETIDDISIIQRFQSLSPNDRAGQRTNPFAVANKSGELVTADEVLALNNDFGGKFYCPKCNSAMQHKKSKSGTPFFAHVLPRGSCPAGFETPSHLCIKNGLRSVGFACEVTDKQAGYVWDAKHELLGVVAEVVCSGLDRYRPKILHTATHGITCWWILDSASPQLCSRWGSERISFQALKASGTVVVNNLFKPKVISVFSAVSDDCLFAFFHGLAWKSIGNNNWQLLNESHALSQAAVAEDGIKHLMVKMKTRNSFVVTENERKGIKRQTWFDQKFHFRGKFSQTWGGDREYVLEMVGRMIRDLEEAESLVNKTRPNSSKGSPREPVHAAAEDIVRRISQQHFVSFQEIAELREIASQSRATRSLSDARSASVSAVPVVLDAQERQAVVMQQTAVLAKPKSICFDDLSKRHRKRIHAANRRLLEIAADRQPKGIPSYYLNNH